MRIEELRWVLVVADEGNLTRAAARLHLSPPSLSEAIRRIEKQLGLALFNRSNRGMVLTRRGNELLDHIRKVVLAADDLVDSAAHRLPTLLGELRVGTLLGYGSSALQDLIESGSSLVSEIGVYGWRDPTAGLQADEVDAAILAGPTSIDDSIESVTLGVEERVAVISANVPAASRAWLSLTELDHIGWLAPARTDPVWRDYWLAAEERGAPAPLAARSLCNTPQELALAVRNGDGAVLAIREVAAEFAVGGEAIIPVRGVAPVPIRVAYRKDRSGAALASLIQALMSRLPPRRPGETALIHSGPVGLGSRGGLPR